MLFEIRNNHIETYCKQSSSFSGLNKSSCPKKITPLSVLAEMTMLIKGLFSTMCSKAIS